MSTEMIDAVIDTVNLAAVTREATAVCTTAVARALRVLSYCEGLSRADGDALVEAITAVKDAARDADDSARYTALAADFARNLVAPR
jgi:hypothetical protein